MLAGDALRGGNPLLALNQGTLALEALAKDQRPSALWPAADAHLILGQAQFALGLYDDAQNNLTVAQQLAPHRAAPWYDLGRLALVRDDAATALPLLRAAQTRRPDDPATRLRLGEALLRDGQRDEGMALLLPLVNDGQADEPALAALTDSFAANGQPQAAIAHLRLALSKRDDPALHARLAQLLWRMGQRAEAQNEINLALQRASDHRLVREVAEEIAAGFPTLPGTL
jgi:Flp pilus assembly protein TadD